MTEVRVFIGLLAVVIVLALLARPLRVAHPVVLVVGGLVVGLFPFAPDVRIAPDLILFVFLPPILFPAAMTYAFEDVRGYLRPIGALAVGLVLVTMAAVAVALHVVLGVAWAPAFVLGAVLGPTDPVSATSVIRRVGAPGRIATILEGESLVNDGTGLAAFRVAVGALGAGTFSFGGATVDFLVVALGGAACGVVVGLLTAAARRRVDEGRLEVLISLLAAYGSFVVAEEIGVSGVLAVVLAGWTLGRRAPDIASAGSRLQALQFWDVVGFLAESVLFLLVGLVFADALDDGHGLTDAELFGGVVLVTATLIVVRTVWMFSVPFIPALVRGRGPHAIVPPRELAVLAFSGMRGAVSIAAALAIPVSAGGMPVQARGSLLFIAFGTVVVTLVGPSLLLPVLLRGLGIGVDEDEHRREVEARRQLAHAALARAEELAAENDVPEDALRQARSMYELRLQRLTGEDDGDGVRPRDGEAYRRLRRALVEAERECLDRLRRERDLAGESLRAVQRDLDLDEQRLGAP
jgi:monovalent cation/hydrogen antiporter